MIETCVSLNTINETTNWAKNSTITPMYAVSFAFPPFLTYEMLKEVNLTEDNSIIYYKYCGPLLLLLKTFAEYSNIE